MDREKKPSGEIVLRGKFFSWLENYWYHYKWITIGVAFAVIVLLVCLLQTCSREKKDTVLVYAGPTYLSVEQSEQICMALEAALPYDFDGDGQKNLTVNFYDIYSEEQIREINAAGNGMRVDTARNSNLYQNYTTYQQTGESSIYLLDPWLYEAMDKAYLCPLSEAGDGFSAHSADGYGVRLGDTALYQDYAVVRLLPADTVICLMRPLVWGGSSDEEAYRFEQEAFCALVTYPSSKES